MELGGGLVGVVVVVVGIDMLASLKILGCLGRKMLT